MLYIKQYLRYIHKPLPPIGDSRKNNSTRKRKLLDPAAAVSCCGGGFATLAAGHAGEESPRRCRR